MCCHAYRHGARKKSFGRRNRRRHARRTGRRDRLLPVGLVFPSFVEPPAGLEREIRIPGSSGAFCSDGAGSAVSGGVGNGHGHRPLPASTVGPEGCASMGFDCPGVLLEHDRAAALRDVRDTRAFCHGCRIHEAAPGSLRRIHTAPDQHLVAVLLPAQECGGTV